MSYKIGVIVPYFGILPDTTKTWMKSIQINHTIKYFLITDQKSVKLYSENLEIIIMSFESLQMRFKEMLSINIKSPYKLCDLKPTYGYVFNDLLHQFKYWGYSDLDLSFGNLDTLVTNCFSA